MTANEAYLKLIHVYFPKSVVMLIKHLENHELTVPEIAEYLRMSEDHAYKLVLSLRQRQILCASSYQLTGTTHRKVFSLGKKDAPRKKLTQSERSKRWREKKREYQDTVKQSQSFGALFGA